MQFKDWLYTVGLCLAIISWFVSAYIVYKQHKRTQLCNSIDSLRSAVIQAEDAALQFWVQNQPEVHYYQLQILARRVSKLAHEVQKINNDKLADPNNLIWRFRKAITLDADNPEISKPISINDKRTMNIIHLSGELQYYFEKPF